ncbi:hypothetical protein FZC76_03045 [Sutcliffiella horikoshii]|uniref:Uncharacterized protein n=1 Tax=Sutcliffiella horikoshii TaxID=79883 RepID=A0A5D4T6J3_9BACI|nr:hypothetical protein [Sutcliffiella horikoshii]TYS70889.1 hypothetical protein FZC76_03045 [Sutcliffiella horikoshii]
MEYLFPMIALFLLGMLVFSGGSLMAYLNKNVHFVSVILTMVSFGIFYSLIARITDLLPAIITMSTVLSLLGIWVVNNYRTVKMAAKELNKQTP